MSNFTEDPIADHLSDAGFTIELLESRQPYSDEIQVGRIFAIGIKS